MAMLLTPIVALFGTILLTVVIGLTIFPLFTITLIMTGDYWWGLATIPAWLAWLKGGGPVRAFVFEGFECAGL